MQGTFHIEERDEMSEFMCINDRIESTFNAAAATQVAFQQPAKQKPMSITDNLEKMLSRGQDSAMLRFGLGSAYFNDKLL